MAIIPADEKVFMVDKTTNTRFSGSASTKAMQQWYTMQDVIDSVGGGGSSTLDIIANGTIPATTIAYSTAAQIPSTPITGEISIPVVTIPAIYFQGSFGVVYTATSVEFPTLTQASSVQFALIDSIQSVSLPNLVTIIGNCRCTNMSNITTFNLPKVTSISGEFEFGNAPLLTNINFPLLQQVDLLKASSLVGFSGFYQSDFPSLTITAFSISNSAGAFEIDMNLITTLTGLTSSFALAPKINLPNVINIILNGASINAGYNSNLVILNIGTAGTVKFIENGATIYFNDCVINSASINNLLTMLASLDGTNGTTVCSNGYLNISGGLNAAPSGAGITAVSTLISRGWTVQTN